MPKLTPCKYTVACECDKSQKCEECPVYREMKHLAAIKKSVADKSPKK